MKKFLTLFLALFFGWYNAAFSQVSVFNYTGAIQTYSVGPGITYLGIEAIGASGGAPYMTCGGPAVTVALGGRVQCNMTVTPGQVLYVYVGGFGQSDLCGPAGFPATTGGWNGGQPGEYYSGGSGGASDIRTCNCAPTAINRPVVAGAGGGGGDWYAEGGAGGGLTGGTGGIGTIGGTTGGYGGTQTGPGPASPGFPGPAGLGTLGAGGTVLAGSFGPGGSGYWGGNCGEYAGGGGGGSSYTDPVLCSAVINTQGYSGANGNGQVTITILCTAGVISGTTSMCAGSTTTLSDTAGSSSGTWSSSNPSIASIATATGVVTGVSGGTATITYSVTIPCGSVYSVATVTVNPLPVPVTGTAGVCLGTTTTLSAAIAGGTWSSVSTGIATVVPATGVVTGLALGTSAITYTLPTGCFANTVVTVNSLPTSITGTAIMCGGTATTLSEATAGGAWSSGNPAIASVGVTTGVVTGGNVAAVNTAVITYTMPGGCSISATVTVNPTPASVLGPVSVCAGQTIVLSDPGGGTWGSSSAAIATIGSATGIVTGLAAAGGAVTITYTLPTGCNTTYPISVSPLPAAITGITAVCEDAGTTTLSDPTAGGYWTSNNTTLATIDPVSGIVTGSGVTTGVDTILYNGGCSAAIAVTVNPAPPAITGASTVCTGSATTLGDAVTAGTWSSSIPSIASVGLLSGIVTGGVVTTPASVTITYTAPTGCTASASVIVYPPPAAITGTMHVCAGQSTVLTGASGGTWASGNIAVATVTPGPTSGGIVTGETPGTATITYYSPGTGCTQTAVVTVNAAPVAITGVPSVCIGSTITLSDATPGGTWTSSSAAIATAGLTSGVIGGVAATPAPGTTTITYSTGGACVATIVVTVHALPAAITGTLNVCAGASTVLADPAGAGLWTSSNVTVATITSAGNVSSLSPGTTTITYTPATGCSRTATLTVNALPAVCTVSGGGPYCSGSTGSAPHVTLSCSTAGVIYRLFNGTTAVGGTVTGTGSPLDFGAETGAGIYTVTATNAAGCTVTMSGSAVVTVSALPALFTVTITGSATYCGSTGVHVTLGGSATGIMYQLFNGAVPVGSSVSGTGGTLDFGAQPAGAYTVVAANPVSGCTRTMTGSVTVTASPSPVITGPTAVCVAATIAEAAVGFTGITWTSSNTTVATVGAATGFVTGAVTGTTTITATSTAGCTATTVVTVTLSPSAVTGANTVCAGATTTESDGVPGGLWSCTSAGIATIGSLTGTVTGVSPGTTIITYSLGGSGCTVTKIMTVTPAPASITGVTVLCSGATTGLADATGGGTWGTSDVAVASVTGAGSVTGGSAGTAAITYTLGSCTATLTITVSPAPAIITGPSTVCAGAVITPADAVAGGTWTSSNTAAATVDGSGNVWGAATGGISTITYSLGGSCVATRTITVNPISAITGSTGLCVGTTTTLTDGTGGGTWSSSNTVVAPVTGSGGSIVVSGAVPGTSTITYTTGAGCTATTTVTVNTAPLAITGNTHVCPGTCTLLSDAAGGGTWSSSNTAVITIDATGLACGIIPGTSAITYSLGFGCTRTVVETVNPAPPAITGAMQVCAGASATLSDAATGGTWESGNTTVATVTGTGGVVWGASPGTAIITYFAPSGCLVSAVVTINPLPPVITGIASLCAGAALTLSDAATGGAWSSPDVTVRIVTSTGVVTGVSAGPATISYTLPGGCTATTGITINAVPPISGAAGVCTGAVTALTDALSGGTWVSSDMTIVTVTPSGTVTGIALGTSVISYTAEGCMATTVVTVHALTAPITGAASVCAGSSVTLTDSSGGGAWSSSAAGTATVDMSAGIVTGVTGGVATITYSLGAGCMVTALVTVGATPAAITGIAEVCAGYTTTLSDATGGGVWSSSNTAAATVIPIGAGMGLVTGVTGGLVTVYYTNPSTGCAATREISVIAVPPISGVSNMCAFGPTMTVSDAATGGVWTSTSASVSSAGVVTAYSAGPAIITYTLSLGCYTTAAFTINPEPGPVMGVSSLCLGLTITLSDTTAGGTWSSSNAAIATVAPIGTGSSMITGFTAGAVTISYTVATGCAEVAVIMVDTFPSAGIITGPPGLCAGTVIVLADPAAGGVWSSSNASASVSGGVVYGVYGGGDTIQYMISNACGAATARKIITVSPLPVAGVITGLAAVCTGDSITLSDAAGSGTWSVSNPLATVSGGIVRGVSTGTDTVKYSVTNSCGTADTATVITINTLPGPGTISGSVDTICSGSAIVLLDTAASGIWSVSNGHISITSAGLLTALTAGTDTITYSITNGCGTVTTSHTVTVKAASLADTITGNTIVCMGVADTLTGTPPGGAWYCSNGNATIIPAGTGAVISGVFAGADTIIYSTVNDCGGAAAAYVVTVIQCDAGVAPAPSGSPQGGGALHVWPNPNDGVFTVMLSSAIDETVQVSITNIVGEKVSEMTTVTNKAMEIKLDNAAGVYFITASTPQGSYVAKVVFAR